MINVRRPTRLALGTLLPCVLAVVVALTASPATSSTTPNPEPSSPTTSVSPSASPTASASVAPSGSPSASASVTPSGSASPSAAASPKAPPVPTGRIIGRAVSGSGAGISRARVVLFTMDWTYVREVRARTTGRFTFSRVLPGRYRIQVSDGRPAWRIDRRAPADAVVRVQAYRDTPRTVRLGRGASITGEVDRGPRDAPSSRALVRATDRHGRTFEVRANARGQFALGGLPPGNYRVWGYDADKRWTGSTVRVGSLKRGQNRDIRVRLKSRAGGVNGYVLEGGVLARGTTYVTAISRSTGQWWVRKVKGGDLSMRGLAPGRYTFVISGTDEWAPRTVKPATRVVPGRTKQIRLNLNQRR